MRHRSNLHTTTGRGLGRRDREQGSALLSVVLILSVVILIVTEMVERQFLDIRRTGHLIAQDQAYLYVLSAEELAIRVLYEDYEQDEQEYGNLVDGLNDEWNRGVVFPLEGGAITAQLSDAQAKFNLNDLLNDRWEARQRLQRLMTNVGVEADTLPEEWVLSMVEWLDGDDQEQTLGAEDLFYLGLDKPYRTGNQLFRSATELRMVKGATPENVDLLMPYITVLPEGVPVNINTVDVELLTTYSNLGDVQGLIDGRGESGYEKLEDAFQTGNSTGQDKPDTSAFSVATNYFMLDAKAVINDREARLQSIIYRPDKPTDADPIRVIHRSRARPFVSTLPKEQT